MNHLELLQGSTLLTQHIIESSEFDDATMTSPTPCREFDVAALIEHIIGTHHFLLSAAGGSADDTGSFADRHRSVAEESYATWAERGIDGTVDLGGNQLPAAFALSLHSLEAFVHGWALAFALDQPFEPNADLVDAAWDAAHMIVSDDNRSTEPDAPYGPQIAAGENASRLETLIAFTGRSL
jgi:uncharacterized protein (TIGR03086 family)